MLTTVSESAVESAEGCSASRTAGDHAHAQICQWGQMRMPPRLWILAQFARAKSGRAWACGHASRRAKTGHTGSAKRARLNAIANPAVRTPNILAVIPNMNGCLQPWGFRIFGVPQPNPSRRALPTTPCSSKCDRNRSVGCASGSGCAVPGGLVRLSCVARRARCVRVVPVGVRGVGGAASGSVVAASLKLGDTWATRAPSSWRWCCSASPRRWCVVAPMLPRGGWICAGPVVPCNVVCGARAGGSLRGVPWCTKHWVRLRGQI